MADQPTDILACPWSFPPNLAIEAAKDFVRAQERRERVAVQCLQAIIRNPAGTGYPVDQVKRAVEYADALLQALGGK